MVSPREAWMKILNLVEEKAKKQVISMPNVEDDLTQMSLTELWQLFPIELVPPCDAWRSNFEEMREKLSETLGSFKVHNISHVGSTALGTIMSKNIVDILLELAPEEDIEAVATTLQMVGFLKMSSTPTRISLNYGYTSQGYAEKVYHLHLRYVGDNAECRFLAQLRRNPEIAKAYEKLKLTLAQRYRNDRDAYTQGKTEFVEKYSK